MTTNAKRWSRMVISRKDAVDITHKCWMKLTKSATTVRAKNRRRSISDNSRGDQKAASYKMKLKNWRRSISDNRRGDQKAAVYKMKLNKACDQTWFLLKYEQRWENKGLYTCLEKKIHAVLTSAIPYSYLPTWDGQNDRDFSSLPWGLDNLAMGPKQHHLYSKPEYINSQHASFYCNIHHNMLHFN